MQNNFCRHVLYVCTDPGAEPPEGEEEAKFITRDVKYLKEVVVAKDPPVVHVYDVVEYGRRFYRTLTYSSDAALSLVSRPPSGVSAFWSSHLLSIIRMPFCFRCHGSNAPVSTLCCVSTAELHLTRHILCGKLNPCATVNPCATIPHVG